ncbi:MAG: methylenetetrahydrofolate reductase [Planctomycetota bacterium]
MKRIIDIMNAKKPIFSFEVFPPKTEKGLASLYRAVEELAKLEPAYVSVTYGAGGSTSKATLEIVTELQKRFGLVCMHHFTMVNATVAALRESIARIRDAGCRNLLALRGDPPPEMGEKFLKIEGGLEYSYELIDLIREVAGVDMGIGVAGFPEGHVDCPSKDLDSRYLRVKIDHGGQFAVTQLFFETPIYSEYLARTRAAGVTVPIVPGVLPIVDYGKLGKFCSTCGATIPQSVHDAFRPIAHEPEAMLKTGTEWAIAQCRDLLARGAPGIHFYCLNKVEPVRTIWKALAAPR